MNLINKIDCGFCIENTSPYHTNGRCKCYKVTIPYNICGNRGVLFLCKGWVNYIMLHLDQYDASKAVKEALAKCIIEKHPLFNSDECIIGTHYSSKLSSSAIGDITLSITPHPYHLKVSMTPMFFIKNIMYEDMGLWGWDDTYMPELSRGVNNYIERKMYEIVNDNLKSIEYYVQKNTGRFKKYDSLINDLLTKIKQK